MNLFKSKKDLFEFKHGSRVWYFTSGAKPVVYEGNTYKPLVISRNSIEDEDIDKCSVDISFGFPRPLLNNDGDDLQALFINKIYFNGVTCLVKELYKNETLIIFRGRVTLPKFDSRNNTMTLTCSTAESYQHRNILTRKFQRTCTNKIYDRFCGLSFDEWATEVEITDISGVNVSYRVINDLPLINDFSRGLLFKDGIYTFINSGSDGLLSLYRLHDGLAVGDVVKIAAGCDQSHKVCKDKFNNNTRYMGFPFMPNSNPINDQIIK